jgi:hypothetical protein
VPVEDVVELLDRWRRSGGVWSRARVLSDGAARISRLTPHERRVLTTALAEQGAPELAARLEAHAADHLPPPHAQAVADGLLSLEGDRLEELVTVLQDPERRAPLVDDALRELPPPPPPGPTDGPDLPTPTPVPSAPREVPTHAAAAPGPVPDETTSAVDVPPRATPAVLAAVGPDGPTTVAPAPVQERPEIAVRPVRQPVATDRTVPDHQKAPLTSHRDLAPTVDRLRSAGSASERFHALDELGTRRLPAREVVEVLQAVPDGWQRRRTVRHLLDAGNLELALAPTVITQLGRTADRVVIAGAMLDAPTLGPTVLEELLPPRAARRLTARRGD